MGVKLIKPRKYFCQGHAIVSGAAADTDIPIAGIKKTDELQMVAESAVSTGLITDRTGTSAILTDGNIQCTVDTATDTLIVVWASAND